MNKTQSIDGVLPPHHAKHASRTPGVNRERKAAVSHSVSQAYKHIVVQELVNMDEIDVHLDQVLNEKAWYRSRGEAKNLLAEVTTLMANNKVTPDQVQFVNHSCGSVPWSDFVTVGIIETVKIAVLADRLI